MHRPSVLLLIALLALAVSAPAAGAHCIKRHSVKVASGTGPGGWAWTVEGTIGNNGGDCREWLFGMGFNLEGAGSWSSSTGIPAGVSYDRPADVAASDDLLVDGSNRVFSGYVDSEVAKIVVTLSNNQHLVIHPKLPPQKLRRKVTWLRTVRYFVRYYPPVAFATGVATLNSSGVLLYRDKTFERF